MIIDKEIVIDDPILTDEAKDLIAQLLDRNISTRLGCREGGFEDIKNHPFFEGVNWEYVLETKYEPPFVPEKDVAEIAKVQFEQEKFTITKKKKQDQRFRGFSYVGGQGVSPLKDISKETQKLWSEGKLDQDQNGEMKSSVNTKTKKKTTNTNNNINNNNDNNNEARFNFKKKKRKKSSNTKGSIGKHKITEKSLKNSNGSDHIKTKKINNKDNKIQTKWEKSVPSPSVKRKKKKGLKQSDKTRKRKKSNPKPKVTNIEINPSNDNNTNNENENEKLSSILSPRLKKKISKKKLPRKTSKKKLQP
eukprot:TRINITY_DN986_c0_g1_i1.p1 TRINITY_DN986_c0_g1~~TRINITY_DN986_c0_g1_i1.p1  ORF type:complete len:305 (+),score=91.56 TRINITY_DN986_c0_g1_i1:239-1153(+)